MSDYHNRIMNIPAGESMPEENPGRLIYKAGHRDARHAAAEIAAEAESDINNLKADNERLRAAAREFLDAVTAVTVAGAPLQSLDSRIDEAAYAIHLALSAHDQGGE